MALTVYATPAALTPAYNDQIFTTLSNQIAVTDFKYIVTVVVNGDTANTYTEDILQRPDGWLVFNASQWVKNYIEHYIEVDAVSLSYPLNIATNKSVEVEVKIKEYYTSAIQSTYTKNYSAFDACLTDDDFRSYDFNDYVFGSTAGKYFLSKTINTITPDSRLALSQPMFIHFINRTVNPLDEIKLELRRGGTTIDLVSMVGLPAPILDYEVLQLFVYSNLFTVATPAVGDIIRVDFLRATVSQLRYSITLTDICTKYSDYVVYYLDRDGNLLFYHFEQKSKKNSTKSINSVRLDKNVLNTTNGAYGSHTYDREQHIISTVTENTLELNTDWLSQTQATALKDLFDSPIVYIWDYNNLRSCKVTNSSFEEYQINNEPLNVLNITVDLGISETRQRGI